MDTEKTYQRIGEFAVSFQWLESKLREIGWFILDPHRVSWPPRALRNESNSDLVDKVATLVAEAIPKCALGNDLEQEFLAEFADTRNRLHKLRRARNRILHSAFIELKSSGEVQGLFRSNPKLLVDPLTGQVDFDQESLSAQSFSAEMEEMARVAMSLNHCYLQLIQRYPHGGTEISST